MDRSSQPGEACAGSFFRLLEVGAGEVARHPDSFDRLRSGELHGVLVHGVYEEELLDGVVARLEKHDPPFLKTWFPKEFRSFFYGRNLDLAGPDPARYFGEAAEFHEHLDLLFPAPRGITGYLAGLLSDLDRGRPFVAAPGPSPDQRYMFTTLRAHLEGGFIPVHCDNEQFIRPPYVHLRTLVEPSFLSFVLALTLPQAGGAFEFFDCRIDPVGSGRPPQEVDLEAADSVLLRIPTGAMLVVDSGRYLHRVTPVEGPTKRWTMCSFMALNHARDATFCWG